MSKISTAFKVSRVFYWERFSKICREHEQNNGKTNRSVHGVVECNAVCPLDKRYLPLHVMIISKCFYIHLRCG